MAESPSPPMPTAEELKQQAATLSDVVRHPGFVSIVQELEDTPPEQRDAKAAELASIDNLRARGVPIPEGMRLTTRWFENPEEGAKSDGELVGHAEQVPGLTICGSLGWFLCISVGS